MNCYVVNCNIVYFGTKKIRNLGGDLGDAVKGFKSAMSDAEEAKEQLNDSASNKSAEDADFDNTPVEETRKDA